MSKDFKPNPDETIAAGASAAGKPGAAHDQKEREGLGRAGNEPARGGTAKSAAKP